MKISTMFYLLGQGIANLFKNRLMSFAAITTISASIFVISIFYIVGENVANILDSVESTIGITVFFEYETPEDRIMDIQKLLEARTEVNNVTYISPEEAWTTFKEDYFKGREDQLSGYEGENPLKDSASLVVYFDDLNTQGNLVEFVESIPDVRHIRQSQQVVDAMLSINQLVSYTSLILVAILILIAVFLISNTIRLGISMRQKEIVIMKYIGAKDSFVKGPFITEGILIGIIGTIIPLSIIYIFYDDAITTLQTKFSLLKDYLTFVEISQIFSGLVPIAAAVGILIGLIGSSVTVGRYLRA